MPGGLIGASALTAGANLLSNAIGGIGAKRQQKRSYELQRKLNSEQAKENYEYGEMAADSAHERSLGLLKAETEANSYQAKLEDVKAAGLSPAILGAGGGGTGGSAGGGAEGTGAKGIAPIDIAAIMQAENEKRAIGIEGRRQSIESAVKIAEAAKIKAETEKLKRETKQKDTEDKLTEAQIDKIRNDIEESLQRQGRFDEKTTAEINKLLADAEAGTAGAKLSEALTNLNDKRTEGYWIELLNTLRQTDINEADLENKRINALANKLSAQAAYMNAETNRENSENPGSFSNIKTWKRAIEDFVDECKEPDNIIGNIIFGKKINKEKAIEIGKKAIKNK